MIRKQVTDSRRSFYSNDARSRETECSVSGQGFESCNAKRVLCAEAAILMRNSYGSEVGGESKHRKLIVNSQPRGP